MGGAAFTSSASAVDVGATITLVSVAVSAASERLRGVAKGRDEVPRKVAPVRKIRRQRRTDLADPEIEKRVPNSARECGLYAVL